MVFSVMDGPKNVMQLRLRPAQDEKPIFCHDFSHRSRSHHIYDDTRFCHNYRHRSVICMTEKYSLGPKCHGCVFFVVSTLTGPGPKAATAVASMPGHVPWSRPGGARPEVQQEPLR